MSARPIPRIVIHPAEQFGWAIRYTPGQNIPEGVAVASATVAAADVQTGEDTTGDVLTSPVGLVTDEGDFQLVTASLSGGGANFNDTRHKVTVTSTLDDGSVYVDILLLVVTDGMLED